MIATAPHAPAPPGGSVDGLGASPRETLQTPDEADGNVGLDDEVDVIALDRELDDAERGLVRR